MKKKSGRDSNVDKENLILVKSFGAKHPDKVLETILNEEITKLKGGEN